MISWAPSRPRRSRAGPDGIRTDPGPDPPEGATLHAGPEYPGPAGTHLAEPFGTKLDVTCKHPCYKDGTVRLV